MALFIFYAAIFIISCLALSWLGSRLIKILVKVAKYLGWREFIVAFFMMSFATSLPNLFVGINAALHKIPQLSFGDIVGGNMVDMTLTIALAVLIGRGSLKTESKMVQGSALFTTLIAILPLILILDGKLTRIDGLILLLAFVFYSFWIFSKEERFRKKYRETKKEAAEPVEGFWGFLKNLANIIFLVVLLILASQGIVKSSQFFSSSFNIPISLVGLLIVGLGNCIPEGYFAIVSARRGQGWMVLGNLMGSVIVCSTLVLGIVVLINPIIMDDFSPFLIARIFTIIAAVLYLVIIKTDREITKKEAMILLFIYVAFLLAEIFRPYLF
jgi:cation:H+ antiporter